jgi:hypothetical protein
MTLLEINSSNCSLEKMSGGEDDKEFIVIV